MTTDRSSQCLEHETLVALIAGQLLLDQNPEVEEHLAECSNCQNIVAAAAAGLAGSQDDVPPSERQNFPKPGDVVAGKYRIEKVVGRGGMGTVFAARHDDLEQTVALKVLHSAAPTATARFQREAKISAQLSSEHIARVYDLGTRDGVPFLVMEYLTGEDLSSVIARGALRPELVVEYAQQICVALGEAHAAGVVHRDLKPSNVFAVRRPDGSLCLKVLDFGVSKRLLSTTGEKSHDLTNAHAVLGSPAYMSPEQLRQSKDVDARSDIWSLGVVLYELLTRKRPFQASSLAGLSAAIAADAPRPPSQLDSTIPPALDRVVMRCLKKEPSERYASAAEVSEALRRSLPPGRVRGPSLRGWLLAAGGLALVTGAWVGFNRGHLLEPERTVETLPQSNLPQSNLPQSNLPQPELPLPAPSPEPPHDVVAVHCDAPYPLGNFRFRSEAGAVASLERAWPIVSICSEDGSAPLRRDLASALAQAFPLAEAALEPAHPCYRLDVQSNAGELRLRLERADRCSLALTLIGPGCADVQKVEVSADGLARVAISSGSSDAVSKDGSSCRRQIALPFEAYGKRLAVHLQPEAFKAKDAVFSNADVETTITRPRRPRPPSPPGPAPLADAPPCVPPNYCRN
ncbi:MAG TPA: serine/threonine-protein kinase [Polyangiaceae bacterium]|nr:serine/threonine-protein kinase [Polyangiaceae bacterium]